ncbi:ABC transporter ATP-binding protein [Candidatus Trichorickettsia mobilis]|uniref:ABC transporter ATP-binding protein n=1 Tax=Candidatus Trichorickettsia mobilis TaxID=1346319 RepID=UPI00292DFE0F|nr:ATP-binding cassette domain-containing protein [Candidatus Trichorickettsia mobilis]
MAKIKIQSLYKSFGRHTVLNGIDLDIKQGNSLVILGGSGTGKSVLIKTIIGLIAPDSGSIIIDSIDTTSMSSQTRFDIMKKCGFLFQNGALFDSLTVQDNITFFAERLYQLSKSDKQSMAVDKLESVGLSEKILNFYPAELSGGMQKRVALARAICSNPEIIFFDEPTTGLDPIMANIINELIIKVRAELGATTITITHDLNSAAIIANDVALIYQGKIIWYGSKEEMEDADDPYLHQFVHGLTEGPIQYT